MRNAFGLVALVLAIAVGIVNSSPQLRDSLHKAWEQALLPVRILRLQAQPPDETIALPVKGVSLQAVTNTWQAPRSGGRKHDGQDIFAVRGTPVLAAAEGYVVRLADEGIGGTAVWIAGAGYRTYYYAHLDRYSEGLKTGLRVQPGAVIGFVGNTGNAQHTPPHLHFGIYAPAGPIDPLSLLNGESGE